MLMLTSIMRYSDPFLRLRQSNYRRNMHLTELEQQMVLKNGFTQLAEKCEDVIYDLQDPHHTHRETPYRGVIPKAQHATATCCRKCLFNWHSIPRYRPLNEDEQIYLTTLILKWVKKEAYHGAFPAH
jgi:hypothetical protein